MTNETYEQAVISVLDDGVARDMASIERLASWKINGPFSHMQVRKAVWRLINRGRVAMTKSLRFYDALAN